MKAKGGKDAFRSPERRSGPLGIQSLVSGLRFGRHWRGSRRHLVFMRNTAAKTKLKHIDCRQEWVRTLRDKDICLPQHVDTELNLADLFTKILSMGVFQRLRQLIMVRLPEEFRLK